MSRTNKPNSISTYRDSGTLPSSLGLWVCALARLWTGKLAVCVMSLPSTTRLFRPSRDFEMGNVTDTRQRLATEPVRAD